MEGRKAALVFTDPPYNVPIEGHTSGNGRVKHKDLAMAVGEMSEAQFTRFLEESSGWRTRPPLLQKSGRASRG